MVGTLQQILHFGAEMVVVGMGSLNWLAQVQVQVGVVPQRWIEVDQLKENYHL